MRRRAPFSPRRRALLALLVIALIAVGFWLLDWQHKHTELAGVKQQKAALDALLMPNGDCLNSGVWVRPDPRGDGRG